MGRCSLHKSFITKVADSYVAKSPKSEILEFVIEDLEYATENIPDTGRVMMPTSAKLRPPIVGEPIFTQRIIQTLK
jgi:hypothetical protein